MTYTALSAQLLGASHGKVGHGFFYHVFVGNAFVGETATRADALLLGQFVDADTALAIQLFPGSYCGDVEVASHPTLFLVGKLGCCMYSHVFQSAGCLPAYSPYVFYGEEREGLVAPFVGIDDAASLVTLVFLGELGTYLGKCLGLGYSYRNGDADSPEYVAGNPCAIAMQDGGVDRCCLVALVVGIL